MSNVSLFDWTIYRHMFSAKRMEAIFGERGTMERWIDVERAVARAQSTLGIIPADAGVEIDRRLNADGIDLERLHEDTVDVGRPIVGLVRQMVEQVGGDHAAWVHYGITTYDAMDTGKVLQLRDGLNEVSAQLSSYRNLLSDLAAKHRDTVMIGRTNNLHAQPMTFGAKVANWIEEMRRHEERLTQVRERVLVVQFGGSVGSLASLQPDGLAFREEAAKELGLGTIQSNWHNARDSVTEMSLCQGNLCASLARIAQNINQLGSTEIGELAEGGEPGRGRSSAMAHKRNPRAAEFAEAVARLGRQRAMGMVEVMGQDHDRCGGTWISEWMLLPETFLLTSGALSWAIDLLNRLEVDKGRMRANVEMTNGLALTERYTIALSKRINKLEARSLLDEACALATAEQVSLSAALCLMPKVLAVMNADEIAALADPETYIGSSHDIVDGVLGTAKDG